MGDPKLNSIAAPDATVAAAAVPSNTASVADEVGIPLATAVSTLTHIGEYVLLGELGRGGMGLVYRAEDPHLKREVALKIMLPQFAANGSAKARFVREARAQAKVEHEHVAAIHQVADHDGLPYLVMPLLKGMTLHAALRANARPPLAEVIRIGREMAEGLAAAHENGLVHRDIKPANIWLEGRKLRVRILDFGLARIAADSEATEREDGPVTREGALVGTPAYMSPQQARGHQVDARTDLWSVGVILYQMTTGELPFNGPNTLAILAALSMDTPPAPIERNPSVPPEFSALIMRLLSKDPAYRPPSADILADELRNLETSATGFVRVVALDSSHAFAPLPSGPDPFAEINATEPSGIAKITEQSGHSKPRKPDSRAWLYAAVGAVALAVLVVIGVVASQRDRKPVEDADDAPRPPVVKIKPKDTVAPVSDYFEVHGVDLAELRAWTLRLAPGFRPTSISARGGTTDVIFDAVALPENREWNFVTTETGSEQAVFDEYRRRGFTPRVRLIHPTNGANALSEVWVRDTSIPWTSWNGRRMFIEDKLREAVSGSLVPTQLAAITALDKQLYGAVVFMRIPGQKWEADLDLQLNDLLRRIEDCREKGWRPKSLATVSDPGRVRFSAVFGENQPLVPWDFQSGISTAEYEKGLVERKEKRQRPSLVTSYVLDGKVNYAVVWEENVDPEADRRVALLLKPYVFSLNVRINANPMTIVRREDPLPDGAFHLVGINLTGTKPPPDFMEKVLLPAVSELRHLTSLYGVYVPVTAAELARLAASPVADNLTELGLWDTELTPDIATTLKKFRRLTSLGLSARLANDDALTRLKSLPRVTTLSLRGLDSRGKAGDRGFEAITTMPLRVLSLRDSDLAPQQFRSIADMPNLMILDLEVGTTDDACVADLANSPKLQRLSINGAKVTNKALDAIEKMASLQLLDVMRTKVTARGVQKLAAARPDLRILWDGGMIEPSKKP